MIKQAWIAPDGAGCYHFCYHITFMARVGQNISLVSGTGKEYDAGTVLKAAAKDKGRAWLWCAMVGPTYRVGASETKQHDRPNVLGLRDSTPLLSFSQHQQ